MPPQTDQPMSDVVGRERSRLFAFIRRRVPDPRDAEDILQEVFCELVEANRRLMPVESVTAWLFRVAHNRITDLFRKRREQHLEFEDLLPSPEDGPHALYIRQALLEELTSALAELPPDQRAVFVAHEIEGRSFKQIAAATGANQNTLLARKRYAVLHLRRRLQAAYDEFIKQ